MSRRPRVASVRRRRTHAIRCRDRARSTSPGPLGMRVPFREIALSPTRGARGGDAELNPPLAGLRHLRARTPIRRSRSTSMPGLAGAAPAVDPGARRVRPRPAPARPTRPGLALTRPREVLRGRGNVTQMHYARSGVVTPEMEFVAIREKSAAGARARRDRARPGDHPGQHQPPRVRADGDRAEVPGQDQRQHRQLGRGLLDRGGGREDDLGDALGSGHGHGPLDRAQHPRDPRVDPAQLARAHRHRPDLPGAREGRRQGRGADLGDLPRHAHRAGRAGRRLLHDPRRRAPAPTCR